MHPSKDYHMVYFLLVGLDDMGLGLYRNNNNDNNNSSSNQMEFTTTPWGYHSLPTRSPTKVRERTHHDDDDDDDENHYY